MSSRRRRLPFAALALAASAAPLSGQIRGSEHGVTAQTIDGTTLTVEYHRPSARGRALFGALVPWGVVWTPGANWATTLDVDRDIRVNGTALPAGTYSVWAIPRPDRWTVTFNPEPKIFHFVKPDSSASQIHVSARPTGTDHVEMLTWSFPLVRGDGAQLRMAWGSTAVTLDVIVEPTDPVQLAADDRALYVGSYDLEITPGLGWPTEGVLEVFESDGMLRASLPFGLHPDDELAFDMIPGGAGRFNPGLYQDGRLFNIEMGVDFEFDIDTGDRATAVRMGLIEIGG